MGWSRVILVVCLWLLQLQHSQTRVLLKRSADITSAASYVVNNDALNAYHDAQAASETASNVCKNCMRGTRQRRDLYTEVSNRRYVPKTMTIRIPLIGPYHRIKEIVVDNSGLHQQNPLPSDTIESGGDDEESPSTSTPKNYDTPEEAVQPETTDTTNSGSVANSTASRDGADAHAATLTLSDTKIITTNAQSVTASKSGASANGDGSASAGGASASGDNASANATSLSASNSTDTIVETNSLSISAAKAASGSKGETITVTLKSSEHPEDPDGSSNTSTSGSVASSKASGDNASAHAASVTLSNVNTTVTERKAISLSGASGSADDDGSVASATSGSSGVSGDPGASATDSYAAGTASGHNAKAHAATLTLADTTKTSTDTTSLSASAARSVADGDDAAAAAGAGGLLSSDGSTKSVAGGAASGDNAATQTISGSLSNTNTATSHTQSISASAANAQNADGTATAAAGSASEAGESPGNLFDYKHTVDEKPTDKISFNMGPDDNEDCDDDANSDQGPDVSKIDSEDKDKEGLDALLSGVEEILEPILEGESVASDSDDSDTEIPKTPEVESDATQSETEE